MPKRIFINAYLFLSLSFYCLAVALSFLGLIDFGLVVLMLACLFELFFIKHQPLSYSSVTFIFIIFSIIYGTTGPITQRWLGGINEIYGDVFDFPRYVLAYSLSEIGLIVGFIIYMYRHKTDDVIELRAANYDMKSVEFLRKMSTLLLIVGVLFQAINTFRVGGFDAIFTSKAYYQAAESALTLTLPAETVVNLAFACLGLYVGLCKHFKIKVKTKAIVFDLLVSIPYFAVLLLLGQRGKILGILVALFLGLTILQPLRKISKKVLALGIMAYFGLAFIYTNRGIVSMLVSNSEEFFSRVSTAERYNDGLNPGKNEFSCAFGNFNKLIIEDNYEFKFGKTYLDGVALLIPSFAYVGERPKQITYEFRDNYFHSESERSAIAGTGFSSILEAYWNFGYLGVLVIFIIYGFLVMYLDFSLSKQSVIKALFVIMISSSLIAFSRKQLADVVENIFYSGIIISIFVFAPYQLFLCKTKGEQ